MQATTDLTSTQWQVADAIARQLVLDQTDLNEFRKTLSYLRAYSDRPDAGKKYFDYLNALARNGDRIGHSKKTQGYLQSITAICQKYLETYKDDADTMLQILGWAARLMQYYKASGPIGEISEPTIQSEREAEIQAVVASQEFFEGQTLEAIVRGVNKNKVTYEMLGTLRLTAKEPKHAQLLSEGQTVTVEITALKPDGSPKNVKFTG
ncbi:hypothetical protein PGN35_020495 [Nodosilinea sp. PGN35]|uniref:hypothetical protein n=1 Tax=Nodosilinea sp. PGN35 TaxID=3020489 RepID=UPI00398B86FF